MTDATLVKLLIGVITALAGVIAYLFKVIMGQSKELRTSAEEVGKERNGWAAERARHTADSALERQRHANELEVKEQELRGDYEKRHRELVERYDSIARSDSKRMLEHEDQVRKEFAEIMETVAAQNEKNSEQLVQLLNKFYDRFVGPRGY
jgi:hypothetical protein